MHAKGHCSRRGASSAWILTGAWELMCLYVYLRGLWECWACAVHTCLCLLCGVSLCVLVSVLLCEAEVCVVAHACSSSALLAPPADGSPKGHPQVDSSLVRGGVGCLPQYI